MKKLLFTSLVILLSFHFVNASNVYESSPSISKDYPKLSTFCKMIRMGNIESVKAFIKSGTDINRKSMGLTPVMYAARYNKVEILKLLIKKGAKLKTKSDRGYTALEYAKMSKAKDAYDVLKEALENK